MWRGGWSKCALLGLAHPRIGASEEEPQRASEGNASLFEMPRACRIGIYTIPSREAAEGGSSARERGEGDQHKPERRRCGTFLWQIGYRFRQVDSFRTGVSALRASGLQTSCPTALTSGATTCRRFAPENANEITCVDTNALVAWSFTLVAPTRHQIHNVRARSVKLSGPRAGAPREYSSHFVARIVKLPGPRARAFSWKSKWCDLTPWLTPKNLQRILYSLLPRVGLATRPVAEFRISIKSGRNKN